MNSSKIKARIYLIIGVILFMLVSVLIFSLYTTNKLHNNLETQVFTRKLTLHLKDNINFLLDAETRLQDFIITGESQYLNQYKESRNNVIENSKQLQILTNTNSSQKKHILELDKLIGKENVFNDKIISLKVSGNEQALKNIMTDPDHHSILDSIRFLHARMQQTAEKNFAIRQVVTAKSINAAKNIFITEFIISLLITVVLIRAILLELALRTKAEKKLQKINAELKSINSELKAKTNYIADNEIRIVGIMEALLKTTQLDFSQKLELSDRGDELDAIAVGLNTLSEELEFHLEELKHSEQKLNDAQRLAKIGNWEMDMGTNKVQWSNEMYNVYGYGNERFDVDYEKALERMLPEDVVKTKERMNANMADALQAFNENRLLEFESPPATYTLVMPDNSRKVVVGIGKIILNNDGQLLKMAGTVQDINEQYKAEKKLKEYNIELERRNKEIQQFAYAASHDLQEPLRSISNFSTLLAEKTAVYDDPEMNEYMNFVSGGAKRMSSLIFDLLEYSRIGKDRSKKIIDCNELVKEIIADLSTFMAESGATVHVENLPTIHCYDLKSVFQNLIINAVKFKKKNTLPVVTISATENETDNIFKIADNGIGIEKEYYDRIFIIFQRLHLRTAYAGTGIGLSLTRKIVEMHGGKIWVESEPGVGSTFYFTIPKN